VYGCAHFRKLDTFAPRVLTQAGLDASLPEGARALIPSPWLVRALALKADRTDAATYRDAAGRAVFIGSRLAKDGSSALVDARLLDNFLKANDLKCLWLFVGERNAWPGGNNDGASRRRSEGLGWLEDGKLKYVNWNKDTLVRLGSGDGASA